MDDAAKGLTVVVSPLVSLMVDQVSNLRSKGVRAQLLAADVTSREDSTAIHREIADPVGSGLRFLYVTPERIAKSKMLLSRMQKAYESGSLLRFAIDEAHCAAAQGHDFRPDYLSLGTLRASFPKTPILCLTATASEAVRADVERTLQIGSSCVRFRGHFDRSNIRFEVRPKPDEVALLDQMADVALRSHAGQAGIVYTFSRNDAVRVATGLYERGCQCGVYHAGMEGADRQRIQSQWQHGRLQVVVATIAFGLGIDKPDVRFVLHHTCSKSLESYYQESGRAGRDGQPADAIVWWAPSDFYKLASLATDSNDRGAAMAALEAAGKFCEDRCTCRRQCLAKLFGQVLPPRQGPEARARCCDVCAAQLQQNGATAPPPERDVGDLAVEALRTLSSLNEAAAAAASNKESGAACAKLTAVKLAEKLSGKLRLDNCKQKLSRDCLEHLVVRLVLTRQIKIFFQFTAYTTLTYLYTPSYLAARLERADCTASMLRLPSFGTTLPVDLLPASAGAAASAATAGSTSGKRKAGAPSSSSDPLGGGGPPLPPAAEPPKKSRASKQPVVRPLPTEEGSDDDDFDFGGNKHGSKGASGGASAPAAEVVVISDDDD